MSETDLAGLTEGLCLRFWGKPTTKTTKELRWGSGGSRSYSFEKRAWFDHEAGEGGGAIDLVRREQSVDRAGALEWLEKQGLINARLVASAAPQRQEAPPADDPPFEPDQPAQGEPKAQMKAVKGYRYTDADGVVLYEVIRYQFILPDGSFEIDPKTENPKKTFRQRRPDGKGGYIWNLEGIGHTIYRHPKVEMAIEAGWAIALCEGEKDVETLERFDAVATTNSGGAKHWTPAMAEMLRGADVVIFADNDDAGREGAEIKARSLRGIAGRIRVFDLAAFVPDLPAKWDITDWIEKLGGTNEQLIQWMNALPDWRPTPPRGFGGQAVQQFAGKPIVYDWLIKGLVARNDVFIFAGEKQAGKSFAIMDMGMKIARGIQYGDRITRKGIVIHVACEDGNGVKMRAEGYRQANQISPDVDIPYIVMDREFTLMNDEVIDKFIAVVREWAEFYGLPVEMIIIDTLSVATEGLNEIDGAEVGKVLARVNRLKEQTGASICLVHHMNASGGRVRGHSSIEANVGQVFEIRPLMTIPQNRRETPQAVLDGEGRHIRQIVLTKNKNGINNLKWKIVLEVVKLGVDADGDEITTCICARPARHSSTDAPEDNTKLIGDQKLVFDALTAAQAEKGIDMPPGVDAGSVVKCVAQNEFVAAVRRRMSFKAGEDEQEARQKELADFLKRTTTALMNAGYMGRDNDKRIVWWTGKSDRPRPQRQDEPERPQEAPGAGIPEDVRDELLNNPVPF